MFFHALVQRALPLKPGLHTMQPRLPIFQIVPMSFRICDGFLQILRVVQIVQVLHMFHTFRPRCTIRYFCLHTKRFEIRFFVLAQFASCLYWGHFRFLIPWTRFDHYVHVITRQHPFISLARNTFPCDTFRTFHTSLHCWFFLHAIGFNAS